VGVAPETLTIGGLDTPILKDLNGQPYIPGSSLRGKLRALLEHVLYADGTNEFFPEVAQAGGAPIRVHACADAACPICSLFGGIPWEADDRGVDLPERGAPTPAYAGRGGGSALDVADLPLVPMAHTALETKLENCVDRRTGQATPRMLERVMPGNGSELTRQTRFRLRLTHADAVPAHVAHERLRNVLWALRLLEDDSLGGGGSRGSGAVQIILEQVTMRALAYYRVPQAQREHYAYSHQGYWSLEAFANEWDARRHDLERLLAREAQ
jgi:CRISPR-associated protein Csm3